MIVTQFLRQVIGCLPLVIRGHLRFTQVCISVPFNNYFSKSNHFRFLHSQGQYKEGLWAQSSIFFLYRILSQMSLEQNMKNYTQYMYDKCPCWKIFSIENFITDKYFVSRLFYLLLFFLNDRTLVRYCLMLALM